MGGFRAAYDSIDKYLQLKGFDDTEGILFKARILYKLDDFAGAISLYDQGLNMLEAITVEDVDMGIYYFYRGQAYYRLNEMAKAKNDFNKSKSLDSSLEKDANEMIALIEQNQNHWSSVKPINCL